MQKLAILGGTFNPVHWGHLQMAAAAVEQMQLAQVLWVPTQKPPHKSDADLLDFQHRLEMVNRAIAPYPDFKVITLKQPTSGPSYAIDTWFALEARYPHSQWFWILGLDAFQSLPRWYQRRELAKRCCWLVAPRCYPADLDGTAIAPQNSQEGTGADRWPNGVYQQVVEQLERQGISIRWQKLNMPEIKISSSLVRQYRRDRRSIHNLVPKPVQVYIEQNQLYR